MPSNVPDQVDTIGPQKRWIRSRDQADISNAIKLRRVTYRIEGDSLTFEWPEFSETYRRVPDDS